jgi:hypothetical protein
MRVVFGFLTLLVVAACEPEVPNSGPGVGFNDYQTYEQERLARDRALETGQPLVPSGSNAPLTVIEGPVPVDPTITGSAAAESVAADTRALLERPAGISDEQDFGAVSARESIESDKQRLAAQRQQFQVVEPQAVPKRPSNLGANVAAFAVSTSHPIGTKVYSRSGTSASKAAKACQKYSSPNGAQQAFLEAGGPDRDRLGVDPDGDGYACGWDPRPFR